MKVTESKLRRLIKEVINDEYNGWTQVNNPYGEFYKFYFPDPSGFGSNGWAEVFKDSQDSSDMWEWSVFRSGGNRPERLTSGGWSEPIDGSSYSREDAMDDAISAAKMRGMLER